MESIVKFETESVFGLPELQTLTLPAIHVTALLAITSPHQNVLFKTFWYNSIFNDTPLVLKGFTRGHSEYPSYSMNDTGFVYDDNVVTEIFKIDYVAWAKVP